MSSRFNRLFPSRSADEPIWSPALAALAANVHYEIVPMKSIEQAISDLPDGGSVSVTCSPTHGLTATLHYTELLHRQGFHAVPHLAARMVESHEQAAELAAWTRQLELTEVYIIAGDAPEPHGPFEGALGFMRDYLSAEPGVDRIGFAGYPDGHALIPHEVLDAHVLGKQALLEEFGVGGWITTQMCFDEQCVRDWIIAERARGVRLPIRIGVPGVVDRARLMRMGTRLGIGASMRYLSKNKSTVMHLMAPGGFDPTDTLAAFADDADELGIEAIHSFTFNAVADTRAWQESIT